MNTAGQNDEHDEDDDDNFLLKPAKSDHPIYQGGSLISPTTPRAKERERIESDELKTRNANAVFCLARAQEDFAPSDPGSSDILMEVGISEEGAAFSCEIFDEAVTGLQSIFIERFGCSENGLQALRGVAMDYAVVVQIAEGYEHFCAEHKHRSCQKCCVLCLGPGPHRAAMARGKFSLNEKNRRYFANPSGKAPSGGRH